MRGIHSIVAAALLALASGAAPATTAFTFVPASNYACLNYCTGYFTSDPADKIGWINLTYAGTPGYTLTANINGKTYQAVVPAVFDGGALYSADGTFITMTDVNYSVAHHCVRVGRGQSCKLVYQVTDGTVQQ